MTTRAAALKDKTVRELRRLLAPTKSCNRADVASEDPALSCNAVNRKKAPRRRGPAKVVYLGETGVTVEFGSRTSKAARYCVRKEMEEEDGI